MEFTIGLESPFSLEYTLESGQVFRWENRGEWWYGVLPSGVLKVRQEGETLRCVSAADSVEGSYVRSYFRLDEDLGAILSSIMKDEPVTRAVQRFYGLRLIRQDFWECLGSFVLATNTNIPRIKGMISSLCARFGDPIEFEGLVYYEFPRPEVLSAAPMADLKECGLGYRAPFLKRVATSVVEGKVDGGELAMADYKTAHAALLKELSGQKLLLGVGPKVADCVLLYSCGKDEAFPIDVWLGRELARSYPGLVDERILRRVAPVKPVRLSRSEYARLSDAARAYFGRYAGFAQQYLYMAARERE